MRFFIAPNTLTLVRGLELLQGGPGTAVVHLDDDERFIHLPHLPFGAIWSVGRELTSAERPRTIETKQDASQPEGRSEPVSVQVSPELLHQLRQGWSDPVQIMVFETPGVGTGWTMKARPPMPGMPLRISNIGPIS